MLKAIFGLALGLFLVFPSVIFAHSGRTNSSGCHNCNVGACAGTYHCHNGGYVAPARTYAPVATIKPATPKPTIKPTVRPTATPTEAPTSSPTSTPTLVPTQSPQVQGASTTSDGGSVLASLAGIGIFSFAAWKGLKWLGRRTAPKEQT